MVKSSFEKYTRFGQDVLRSIFLNNSHWKFKKYPNLHFKLFKLFDLFRLFTWKCWNNLQTLHILKHIDVRNNKYLFEIFTKNEIPIYISKSTHTTALIKTVLFSTTKYLNNPYGKCFFYQLPHISKGHS